MPAFPAFRRHIIHRGQPSERTRCVVGDLKGDGRPAIAGKPFRVLRNPNRDPEVDCVHLWLPE